MFYTLATFSNEIYYPTSKLYVLFPISPLNYHLKNVIVLTTITRIFYFSIIYIILQKYLTYTIVSSYCYYIDVVCVCA